MRLIIIRHGKTHQDPPEGSRGRDEDRELMERGVRQSQFLGELLAGMANPPQLVVSSGIERAVTTANLINSHLGVVHRVDGSFEFGTTPSQAVEAAIEHCADAGLMDSPGGLVVVGHNPQLECVLALLLDGAGAGHYRVRTGEAFALEVDPEQPFGTARLEWSDRLEE